MSVAASGLGAPFFAASAVGFGRLRAVGGSLYAAGTPLSSRRKESSRAWAA